MKSQFKNKNILITGASGLVGSRLSKACIEEGAANVYALSRSKSKLKKCFRDYEDNKRLHLISADICRPLPLFDRHIDYIFHCAGPISREIIENRPVSVYSPNILGTLNCLDYILNEKEKSLKTKLVFLSSITVYANLGSSDLNVSEEKSAITDTLDSYNAVYSQSKRMAEVIIKSNCKEKGVEASIGRLGYVYGPTLNAPETAFYSFIKDAINGKDLVIHKRNLPCRDNIFIDDVINGLFDIALQGENGESYNLSSNGELGNFASLYNMAENIVMAANQEIFKSEKIKLICDDKTKDINNKRGGGKRNNNKLKFFNWSVKTDIYTGIVQTLKFFHQLSLQNAL